MFRIGDIEVHRIEEIFIHEPMNLFPDFEQAALDDNLGWLTPHYYDAEKGMFPTSVHSWLLKTPKLTILIDTCGGNGKTRPVSPRFHQLNTPYLDRLRAVGTSPEDVDYVILTHLHIDHVGWNTRLENGRWVPTFPNATYLMSRAEHEAADPQRGAKNKPEGVNLPFLDSVQPIVDAGLAQFVEGNEKLFEGMELMPIPGHTAGMMALSVKSQGQQMLFAGDIAHQPIQIACPDWSTKYCADPKQAAASRRKVFDYCAETGALLLPVHFGWPYCGRISSKAGNYSFLPFEH